MQNLALLLVMVFSLTALAACLGPSDEEVRVMVQEEVEAALKSVPQITSELQAKGRLEIEVRTVCPPHSGDVRSKEFHKKRCRQGHG